MNERLTTLAASSLITHPPRAPAARDNRRVTDAAAAAAASHGHRADQPDDPARRGRRTRPEKKVTPRPSFRPPARPPPACPNPIWLFGRHCRVLPLALPVTSLSSFCVLNKSTAHARALAFQGRPCKLPPVSRVPPGRGGVGQIHFLSGFQTVATVTTSRGHIIMHSDHESVAVARASYCQARLLGIKASKSITREIVFTDVSSERARGHE